MTPSTTLDKQRRRLTIEMHNPVRQIFEELNQPGITQASVAITYAFIIAQEPHADWTKINAAIQVRWKGNTALERIKMAAWKYVDYWRERGLKQEGDLVCVL